METTDTGVLIRPTALKRFTTRLRRPLAKVLQRLRERRFQAVLAVTAVSTALIIYSGFPLFIGLPLATNYIWNGGGDGVSWDDDTNWTGPGGTYPDDNDDYAYIPYNIGGDIVTPAGAPLTIGQLNHGYDGNPAHSVASTLTLQNDLTVEKGGTVTNPGRAVNGYDSVVDANGHNMRIEDGFLVIGTLNCGSGDHTFGIADDDNGINIADSPGIFNGGSGDHTMSLFATGSGTATLTSGTTTLNKKNTVGADDWSFVYGNPAAFSAGGGTLKFTTGSTNFRSTNNLKITLATLEVDTDVGWETGGGWGSDLDATSIIINNGDTLTLAVGGYTYTVSGQTTIYGTLVGSSSTMSLGATYTADAAVLIDGGILNQDSGTLTIGSLETSNGTLTQTGTITVSSAASDTDRAWNVTGTATYTHNNNIVKFTHDGSFDIYMPPTVANFYTTQFDDTDLTAEFTSDITWDNVIDLDNGTIVFGEHTYTFKDGAQSTFAAGTTVNITKSTLVSSNPGTACEWNANAAANIVVSHITVTDNDASPGATIYAYDSTNGGNNDNWVFRTSGGGGHIVGIQIIQKDIPGHRLIGNEPR